VATSQWLRGALLPRTTGRLRLLQQQQLQEQEQDLRLLHHDFAVLVFSVNSCCHVDLAWTGLDLLVVFEALLLGLI